MNPFELALAIVLIVTIGSVLKSRQRGERETRRAAPEPDQQTAQRLQTLEERVAVLERIVTDRGYELRQKFRDLEDG